MSKVVINDTSLTAIGDAIRKKTGKSDLLLPSEMPSAIESISSSGGGGSTGPSIPMLPPGQNIMQGRDGGLVEQRWVKLTSQDNVATVQDLGFDSIEDFASRCVFIAGMMSTVDGSTFSWDFKVGFILPWLRQDVDNEIIEGGLDRTKAPSKRDNWPLFGIINSQAYGTYSTNYMSNNGVGYNERWYQGNKRCSSVGMTLLTPGTSSPDRYWSNAIGCWGVNNDGVFRAEIYSSTTGAYKSSQYLFGSSYPIMVYSLKK